MLSGCGPSTLPSLVSSLRTCDNQKQGESQFDLGYTAGTYSTQPAVTVQTFGHKYGGFIYAFLFSGDIINNLLTALMSRVRRLILRMCD